MDSMIDRGVGGNRERVFISIAIGCKYQCKYCYLNEMDYPEIKIFFTKDQILEELKKKDIFVPGEQGSIISIGCYTECWDDSCRDTTLELIKYFLKKRNYVQLSTKKIMNSEDIQKIKESIQFDGQFCLFISAPTISNKSVFEPLADDIMERVKNLGWNDDGKIHTCLYVKPVLPGFTINDKEKYLELIRQYKCPVVVGDMLSPQCQNEEGLVEIGFKKMRQIPHEEAEKLRTFLRQYTTVYEHSTDVIQNVRKQRAERPLRIKVEGMGGKADIYMPKEMQSYFMGDDLILIQNIIADNESQNVTVHFEGTVWIDNLVMIELFLMLYEMKESGKAVFFDFCFENSEPEQVRFLKYCQEYGFFKAVQELTGAIPQEIECLFSGEMEGMPNLALGNFEASECLQPFCYIAAKEKISDFINNVDEKIKDVFVGMSVYEAENIRFALLVFLQETLGNVFEHAYGGKAGVCGVMIRYIHNFSINTASGKRRNYYSLSDVKNVSAPFKNESFDKKSFRQIAASLYNPYRNDTGMKVLEKYLQVFVVDRGSGILDSMEISDPTQERNIINEIFEHGKRSEKRKNKNTYLGGLGMIYRLFGEKGNYISVKGIYNWASIFCGKKNNLNSTLPYVHRDGYHPSKVLKGLAVIGYIDSQSEKEISYFKPPEKRIMEIYKRQYTTKGGLRIGNVEFVDLRFSIPELKKITWKDINICFVGENLEKGIIANHIAKAAGGKSLIIVDIPEKEMRKYELIFDKMTENITRVILVSLKMYAAVFEFKKGRMEYNKEKTERYIKKEDLMKPAESLMGLLNMMRFHDSKMFWDLVSDRQKNQQVHAFVNGEVIWPETKDGILDGYLDFSQTCFDDSVKLLLAYQIMRIPADKDSRFFHSMDRFSEDICDNVNGKLAVRQGTDYDENSVIDIGSVYVTGISSIKSKLNYSRKNEEYYYFVRETMTNFAKEAGLKALLMWPDRELADRLFKKEEGPKFQRLSKTPFIAEGGTAYFSQRHYAGNSDGGSIYINPVDLYELLEKDCHWTSRLIKVAHFAMPGQHDIINLNAVSLFRKNVMEGSRNSIFIRKNCYDFLLWQMYMALGKSKNNFNEAVKIDIKAKYQSVVYGKLSEKEDIVCRPGVFVYLTDYETMEIMEVMKKPFSEELRTRIIPIAPINRNREAAALLLSPILMDNIRDKIEKIKHENNEEAEVTIFCATITSTRLQGEIKHILYRLGATKVKCICLVDRQRFPLGSRTKNSYYSFCKLDLPQMGKGGSCALCTGLAKLEELRSSLAATELSERCHEIAKTWMESDAFDNYWDKGILAASLEWPDSITALIKDTVEQYGWSQKLRLHTDIGLILFAVENAVATMTIDFLKRCLAEKELLAEVKVQLMCVHLLIFENEIVESDRYDIVKKLYIYLKETKAANEYTALACLVIMAQEDKIKKALFEEMQYSGFNQTFENIDFMLTYIELVAQHGNKKDLMHICGFLKQEIDTHVCLYGIMQYTYKNLKTRHHTILCTLESAEADTPSSRYISAESDVRFLISAYTQLLAGYFQNPANWQKEQEQIIGKLRTIQEILHKGAENGLKESDARNNLTTEIREFFKQANEINKNLYMDSSSGNINKLIEKLRELKDEAAKKGISIYVNETFLVPPNLVCFFVFTENLAREILFLMEDFRYSDKDNQMEIAKKKYAGRMEVIFGKTYMSYRFKNYVKDGFSIEDVRMQKKLKQSRPTIVLLCNALGKRPSEIFAFEYDEDKHLFTAEIRIEYLYVTKEKRDA